MENINKHYHSLAFFDLDGTLLNKKSQLDKDVIQALHTIRDKGTLPIIATGRGHFELTELMALSGITSAIAMNVAHITKLKALADAKQQAMAFYDKSGNWVSRMTQLVKDAYAYINTPLPGINDTKHLTDEVNMLLVFSDQPEDVTYYREHVQELAYFKNSPFSIDIVNAGSNKGTGVNKVIDLLGFTGKTYGFGDGPNDIDLLANVDYATAMGNAIDELKTTADFVTTANTDRGIINAFEHWGLL